jgi:hypothetical protein
MVEARGCLPYRTIYQDADLIMVSLLDPAYYQPAFRHRFRVQEGSRQGVVVSPGEDKGVWIGAGCCGNCLQRFGNLKGIPAEVDEYAGSLRHMPKISKQAVGDVDHGCGAGLGSDRAGSVAQLRHSLGLHQDTR